MILFAGIVFIFIFLSVKRPDFMFWLAVTIFMDPGGFIQTYISRNVLGGLQITDLTFLLLLTPLISPKIKISSYFKIKDNRWIFIFLLTFAVIYHVLIYGYIATDGSLNDLFALLQYQRLTIWGFIAIVPAYIFFKRNYVLFFKFALITSAVIMFLYILRMGLGFNLLPIVEFERSRGSGIMRVAMLSYGFAQWFLYLLLIKIIYRLQLPKINWFYFIAIVIFIAEILTLTRRVLFSMFFMFFLIYYLHQKMTGKAILSIQFRKILFAFFGLVLILYLVAPKYINYSLLGISDTISIIQKGESTSGVTDNRIEGDIPQHLARFKESPIIGYGWDELWYSNASEEGGLSANDVPLTAALGMFGILGLAFFSLFYLRVFKILYKSYKLLKHLYLSGIAKNYSLLFGICLFLTISFITKYTIGFMSYFNDLVSGIPRVTSMLYLGFLLAAYELFRNIVRQLEPTLVSTIEQQK